MKRSLPILCTLLALATYLVSSWHAPLFMDEYSFQRNVAYFAQTKSITPVFARYPPLYSYLIAPPIYAAFLVFYALQDLSWSGLRDPSLVKFLFAENLMIWVWVARVITMLFGAALVFGALRFALRRYSRLGALVTAALLLMDPFGFMSSVARYGLPDIPVACLVTAAVLFCVRALDTGNRRLVLWAAVAAGLAGSMKVNGLLAVPAVCVAAGFAAPAGRRGRAVLLALLVCAAGFAAGSPSMILSPQAYAAELQTERGVLIGSGHLGAHGTPWVWIAEQVWRASPVTAMLVVLALAHALRRRTREDWLLLAILIPAILVIGALQKKALWYFVPVYPLVALCAGRAVQAAWEKAGTGRERALAGVMLALVLLLPGLKTVAALRVSLRPDNTTLARRWIEEHVPAGAPVLVDWAYVPDLRGESECRRKVETARSAGSRFAGEIEKRYRSHPVYDTGRLADLGYNMAAAQHSRARWLVTSSGCYQRFLPARLADLPAPDNPLYEKFMARRAFYQALFEGKTRFRPTRIFSEGSGPVVWICGTLIP